MDSSPNKEFDILLTGFTSHLREVRGSSSNTASAYRRDVAGFLDYLMREKLTLVDGMTTVQASMYLMETMQRKPAQDNPQPISARSASRLVSALKAFGAYLVFASKLDHNPLEQLHSPKYSRCLPVYYTVDEVTNLVTIYDEVSTTEGLRNRAILHVLYGGGLRVSECAGLDIASVNITDGWLSVHGKGGKQRIVPLGNLACSAIKRWLDLGRSRWANERSGTALFLGKRGQRIGRRMIQTVLDRAALAAGLAKPVSPHKLRHACATHMLEGGADVRIVQELLGHEKLGTTQIYTQVTRTHLRDVYLTAHPRAKLPPNQD